MYKRQAFGGILSGGLADRNGRKKTLLVLAALFIIGALGTSLAPTAAVMVIFRFILGPVSYTHLDVYKRQIFW